MASVGQIKKLRKKLDQAISSRNEPQAIEVLTELMEAEENNPRWPHRRGDLFRKKGDLKAAVVSYERAARLYAQAGFITRAAAMAKTIMTIDASRTDVLERVDPEQARRLTERRPKPMIPSQTTGALLLSSVRASEKPAVEVEVDDGDDDDGVELSFDDTAQDVDIEIDLSEDELSERTDAPAEPTADRLANLPAFPLFGETPREAFKALVQAAELVEKPDGAKIIKAGDPATSLFAIVEGAVRVMVPGSPRPIVLAEGDVVGESCLLESEPRRADVLAHGKLVALEIPKVDLLNIVARFPEVGRILFELLTRRQVGNVIQTSPLFAAFDLQSRCELARLFEVRRAAKGTVLVEAGKGSTGLCLPLTGMVRIQSPDGERAVNRLASSGLIFGQGSLLSQEVSSVTVKSLVEMIVLWLPANDFLRVASHYPPALAHLSELASEEPGLGDLV